MQDILITTSLLGGWIVLNLWILPWFGISTCMSGACRVPHAAHGSPPGGAGTGSPPQTNRTGPVD